MSSSAITSTHISAERQPLPRLAIGVVIGLCAAKLLLHIFTSVRHYGYFRDELYYLDLARHLDWATWIAPR
jgi:nicotinamide riboside transporter PnuC